MTSNIPSEVEPTERADGTIRIRPFEDADIDPLYKAVRESISDLQPWLPWCHADYSRGESHEWVISRRASWFNGEAYSFAVVEDTEEQAFLGGCGLNQINPHHHFANLGYWVRSTRTGEGIATAAARMVAQFGFETLRLNRVEITTAVGNAASRRVAEKLKAKQEGYLRRRIVMREEVLDAHLFALIPEDAEAWT